MTEIRRSPQAETDSETILVDLQQKNPAAAERYATAFYDKDRALAQFPEIGRSRPEIAPNLHSTLVHSKQQDTPPDSRLERFASLRSGNS
jgi:plasmid stabilization system protein ParE